jgi:hypothetical protein
MWRDGHNIRQATNGGFVLGPARFAQEIAHALGRRVERGKSGRPARATEPEASSGHAPGRSKTWSVPYFF